ncbi:hypothetical protein BJF78_06535 [Pseudonocardia sp. CNS-139]|nr:hypothetical protein BJF78_06535 [Pseudonocardia sp. CNS-139]
MRWWSALGVLLAVVLAAGMTACSGPASAQTGDCVEQSGDTSYTRIDCAGAQLRVLERIEGTDADCTAVPGVTQSFTDYSSDYSLCLGPLDVDPAAAVNVAQVGDCLSGVDAGSGQGGDDVHRVDCADPAAGAQVISRQEDVFELGFECDDVPGTTATYAWSLDTTSSTGIITTDIDSTDVLFCLGPAGVDPATSPDTAQAGDCLRETGDPTGYAKVDCGAPDAAYRVVERVDVPFIGVDLACGDVPAATGGIQSQGGLDGYVLCIAPN